MSRRRGSEALSALEGALLGLLALKPQSGYALRKVFQETPIGHFSDSPGSIYPALRRLQTRGWIAGKVEGAATLRPREVFSVTAAGNRALRGWLLAPVTPDTVSRGTDEAMLRFVFLVPVLGRAEGARFLRDLARELAAHRERLAGWRQAHGRSLPVEGRLALDHGLAIVATELAWTRRAARHLAAQED
ncbi:MAG TPA: PadR family transcriptional regulator [Vicinamibacterales bacterium]